MHYIVRRACGGSTDDDNRTARATGHRPDRGTPRCSRMAIPVIGRLANALILGLGRRFPKTNSPRRAVRGHYSAPPPAVPTRGLQLQASTQRQRTFPRRPPCGWHVATPPSSLSVKKQPVQTSAAADPPDRPYWLADATRARGCSARAEKRAGRTVRRILSKARHIWNQ